ncbi:MAG: ABC transporter permease [Actinobacteria bacterium]|nr:ABC transporter permease [Actinomycetota bacterium]NIS36293.1 ABC transporter permease [Actinomycetota bacterium]NIT98641.1 ABC transporter permease [Actinomycetota bacterium]NIU22257.1 ABC transporter permease [Actinomycetota bacterium]NIU70839.1 ABC transporter permease [Actinomycetota bacterium]
MRVALLELRRRPGRFAVAGGALTLLSVLLLFLGGLLDGLFLNSTGAIRAADPDLIVFSDDARSSFLRSSIDPRTRTNVESTEGVARVGGLGISLLGVRIPGESDVADGAIVGYELESSVLPAPPEPGRAYADRRLGEFGLELGQTVLVGPAEVELEVVAWVDDTNYLLQGGLWVDPDTWREVQNRNRPDAPVDDGEFQALVVRAVGGTAAGTLQASIDAATGTTESLTETEAVFAIPGVTEQDRTFGAIIWVTVFVAGLVSALFFALMTIERQGIYAVFKAIGATSRTLAIGLVAQAAVVAAGAFALAGLITVMLSFSLPPDVPAQFETRRVLLTLASVLLATVVGGLVSLRRITAIDPASAIGAGA